MDDGLYPHIVSGPPRPSVIRNTGALALPAGTERYHVEGGGAVLVMVCAGDRLSIENSEGGQIAELLAFGADKKSDLSLLDISSNAALSDPSGLKTLLSGTNPSLRQFRYAMTQKGFDVAQAKAAILFSSESQAKETCDFTAQRDGAIIIVSPPTIMDFEAQNTATPLAVFIRRKTIKPVQSFDLPTPLADPIEDKRIHSATAGTYFVKAGDYIQIIDKDGRQCTDFQCFSARKLDKGQERALDVTTTRTLMGHAYPMPGLHGKYYDQDMDPLIEVVQDTCGRHDAFALACAAKYYDDIGYPGHSNCSDNFNFALQDYDIEARAGWMAINFFFNTGIDEHGVMYADEPWSRPGDYVLLRALTDLICVSSACPDDTSPANGWTPTDIHVRTYDGVEKFHHAIAFRATPDSEPMMTKQTAFHDSLAEHTRNFVEYNGYWLANCYAAHGPLAEYKACREKAILLDLSALRKFEITGPDSEALLDYIFTRNIKAMPVGGVVYTAMCYPHGGMLDDGTVFRLARDNFRWIGGSDYGGDWIRDKAEELGLNVWVRSSTDSQHNIAVQGPHSRDILKQIIWTAPHQPALEELNWFRFTPARIGTHDGPPIVVSRTGYTGELGYEIFTHPKFAKDVFDAVWDAGQPFGMVPMGLEALDMVRIEAGLIFADYEFSDQTDPFEAGIGFTVPLKSKEADFIGREALIRRKENPVRKLVGLEIESDVEVVHGDCVHIGRAQIGEVTSSMRSPLLGKNIALARVDVTHHAVGTKVEIGKLDGHQKRLPATIVPFAHYDPQKTKPRS